MPFLDILVTPQDDGTLTTSVYRKPTHTESYLQWDSHHNLACKYSVINTLTHRAKAVCTNSKLPEEEMKHLHEVLQQCKYPKWAINKVLKQQEHRRRRNRRDQGRNTSLTQKRCHIVVPYTKGLCESYKTICGKYGVQVYFKGRNTLKDLLMFPKKKWQNRTTSYTGTNVVGLNAMMSILGSQPELLRKDTKNTWRHHHQYLNITKTSKS